MRKIKVFKFNELPLEVQKKIHKRETPRENPWADENYKCWENFLKDVFPGMVRGWDSYRKTVDFTYSVPEIYGEKLAEYLNEKLSEFSECPSGYCFDVSCYGYAKEHVKDVITSNLNFEDFILQVFRNFVNDADADDEYYNSFEAFKDDAIYNDYEYTESGIQV